jgi:predicted MFS family arabinose efflux permease
MEHSLGSDHVENAGDASSTRLILLSLVISTSVVWIPSLLAGILLIDIGETFGQPVGVVGQLFTVTRIVGVASALVLGVLSARYSHKRLLTLGLFSYVLFAVGCFVAPSFGVLVISFSFSGLGLAVVLPMALALVGEHLPEERRAGAIGWISISTAISGIFIGPLVASIVAYGGWRLPIVVFVLPLTLLGLVLVQRWLPSSSDERASGGGGDFLGGFRAIFSDRSAFSCLIGYALALAAMTVLGSYCPSFLRERFLVSTSFVSTLYAGINLLYSLGSAVASRLVDRFSSKLVLIVSLLVESALIMYSTNSGSLWVAVAVILVAYTLMGVVYPVAMSLTLEQTPGFRGTIMALNSAAGNLGMAVGAGMGGMVLLAFDYGMVGVSLGALGILGTLTYLFLVVDPTRG